MDCLNAGIRHTNKPDRFQRSDLGGLEMVCWGGGSGSGGGGSSVNYVQSPEERAMLKKLLPVFNFIYPGGQPTYGKRWVPGSGGDGGGGSGDVPTTWGGGGGMSGDESKWEDQEKRRTEGTEGHWERYKTGSEGNIINPNLYDIPDLKFNLPKLQQADINEYIAGGKKFDNVYDQIAPSLWNAYDRNVQNPLINRFAGSGSLGSASGGLSGAASDALTAARNKQGADINAQTYQFAQAPLLQAFQAQNQGNLAKYGAGVNAAMQSATMPWTETIKMRQYPFQILPGLLGGTMPQPVVTQSSGGGK